jgi:hypothetical protein
MCIQTAKCQVLIIDETQGTKSREQHFNIDVYVHVTSKFKWPETFENYRT